VSRSLEPRSAPLNLAAAEYRPCFVTARRIRSMPSAVRAVRCSIRRDSGNECTAGFAYSRSRMPDMAFPVAFLPRILVSSLFSNIGKTP
jgi:hypothetical protein